LAALIGYYNPMVGRPNVLKPELEIFGDHACDLLLVKRKRDNSVLLSSKMPTRQSVQKSRSEGNTRLVARLERGFSQIIDWFYLLADNHKTHQFQIVLFDRFGELLRITYPRRDGFLTTDDLRHRLRWRSQNTLVAGKQVHILTFDELLRTLR